MKVGLQLKQNEVEMLQVKQLLVQDSHINANDMMSIVCMVVLGHELTQRAVFDDTNNKAFVKEQSWQELEPLHLRQLTEQRLQLLLVPLFDE